jgi:hypothetical protein
MVCTKTGREDLKELRRVNFPDCRLLDGLADGREQLNLGARLGKTSRKNWYLVISVIDKSETKCAICSFRLCSITEPFYHIDILTDLGNKLK